MQKPVLSQIVTSMPESGIEKFFGIANTVEGAISLGVGEPDFATPSYVRQVAIDHINAGHTKYTTTNGMDTLREAVSSYLNKYDLYYKKEQVLVTVGASEGIDLALRALCNPLDEVLYVEPCYVSYLPSILLAGATPVALPTKAKNQFKLMASELEEKLTSHSKILMLSYPNNPTGAIMTKEDLEPIAALAIKHNLLVITDEIYAELTYQGTHFSIAAFPDMAERTIVLNGFSKAFAMTGWRLGVAAGPTEIIRAMNKIHQYSVMTAGTISQYAALEALTNPLRDDEITRMRTAYDERRTYLLAALRDMGLDCFEPFGAFYVFPSIQKTGLTSEAFAEKLLEEEKVAIIPGNAFGACGEGFLRCSYAYALEDIKKCMERMERFVRKILV